MADHPEIGKLEYNQITKYIYIGTNACCQPRFDRELLGKGIEANISLEEEKLDTPYGVKFSLWLPVKNHTVPTQEQLRIGVAVLEQFVKMKKKVYVHCQNGHQRAPILVAAYFIYKGMTTDEALRLVKSKRRAIHPNESQIKALNIWQKESRKYQKK